MPLVVLVVVVLLAQLGLAPLATAAPPSTPAPTPVIAQRYLDQAVAWQTCPFDAELHRLAAAAPTTDCASVVVPMDWEHPDAHPDVTIAISFTYATGGSRGLLFASPGGPGTAGRAVTAALAVDHPELSAGFDLLGIDPRGYGDSQRLTCTTTAQRLTELPVAADPSVRTRATRRADHAAGRLLATACSGQELAGYVSTRQTAYDLAFVRTLLGYTTLSLLGYGYGTRLVSDYAALYPQATAALVVDSAETGAPPAAATELRRTQFLAWLARHDDVYRFGTTTAAVAAAYANLRARLALRSDPAELDAGVTQAITTDAGFLHAADDLRRFAAVADGTELTDADREALATVRSRLALTERGQLAAGRAVADAAPDGFAVDLGPAGAVTVCNDALTSTPTQAQLPAPRMCRFWPRPAGPADVEALRPTVPRLIVAAAADPSGGLAAATESRSQATSSALVVVADSAQHGVALAGVSGCADQLTLTYLLTGVLPADTVCAGAPLPLETEIVPFGAPVVPVSTGISAPVSPTTAVNPVLAGILADAAARP